MGLPIIQRRYYGVYDLSNDQTTNSNLTSTEENNKHIVIHISIIFSVIVFIVIVGVILFLYRRRLRKSKSCTTNLNRVINITHLTNTDDIILDYYSNSHDYNKSSSENKIISTQLETVQENEYEPELSPPSPTQSLTRENRNYFIYAKNSDIISRNNNDINNENIKLISDTNNEVKSDKNNDETIKLNLGKNNDEVIQLKSDNNEITNTLNNSIKRHNSKKRTKVNFNLISGPITSPSDSIYNNEKADSLSRTTTRVIPPVPTFSSNKSIRQKEILRGTEMTEYYLARQFSDASAATIIDTAIDDNPIMEITKKNKKIITTEEAVLDMIPIDGYDGGSNLKNSY